MKHPIILLISTFLFFNQTFAINQVSYSILTNDTIGCSPFVVSLRNETNDLSSYTYKWTWGSGSSDNADIVDIVLENTGTYNVKLTAYNSQGVEVGSYSQQFVVYKPEVEFVVSPTEVCIGKDVEYSAIIKNLPAGIVAERYIWNFGDGSPAANSANVTHQYQFQDVFDVILQAKDSKGCYSDIVTKKNIVTTYDNFPVVDITYSPKNTVVCDTKFELSITNRTVGDYSYSWNFGDGTTSSEKSPANHLYSGYGKYFLEGSVTNNLGCSAPVSPLYIELLDFTSASFTMHDEVKDLFNNSIACPGTISFINTTKNAKYNRWYLNGVLVSESENYEANLSEGNYEIKLISGNGVCEHEKIQNFSVEPYINRNIVKNDPFSCSLPYTLNMSVNNDIRTYNLLWKVKGDEYTTPDISVTYEFDGKWDDTLFVTSPNGCKADIPLGRIEMLELNGDVIADTVKGCIPLEVNFSDMTKYNPSLNQDKIVSWEWLPYAGHSIDIDDSTYTYTYTQDGTFTAYMYIKTAKNCTDTVPIIIKPGDVPIPNPVILDDTICAGEIVGIRDMSTDSTKIDYRFVQFRSKNNKKGGGTDVKGLGETLLEVTLDQDTGWFDMLFQVKYHECKSVPEIYSVTNAVYVKGPVAWPVMQEVDCENPYHRTFTLDSIYGADKWTWDLVETKIENTTLTTVSHTYSSKGRFEVKFKAESAECKYEKPITVTIADVKALFTTDQTVCKGDVASFDYSSSVDAEKIWWYTTSPTGLKLISQLEPESDESISFPLIYNERGVYTVGILAEDVNSCRDSATVQVTVSAPYASFISPQQLCLGDKYKFESKSSTTNILWTSDGDIGTSANVNFEEIFSTVGKKGISLKAIASDNCTDILYDTVEIISSEIDFKVLTPKVCTGNEGEFIITKNTGTSALWEFGDGSISGQTSGTISHKFTQDVDSVVLNSIIYTTSGRKCSFPTSHPIDVKDMSAEIVIKRDSLSCFKYDYIFTPKMKNPTNDYIWYAAPYGIFDTTKIKYPEPYIQFPGMAGWHKIALVTYSDYKGCEEMYDTISVYIGGARADFTISEDTVCIGDEIKFKLTSDTMNIANNNYMWIFGDGTKNTSDLSPQHSYTTLPDTGFYKTYFIMETCMDVPKKDIYIKRVLSDFWLGKFDEDSLGCAPYTVSLLNRSEGDDERKWMFPDGSTSSESNPEYTFTNAGELNNISLFVSNKTVNCPNTKTRTVRTYPSADVSIKSKYTICEGDSLLLSAEGNYKSFEWITKTGMSQPDSAKTWIKIDTTVYVHYKTLSVDGCLWADSSKLYLQKYPDYTGAPYTNLLYNLDNDTISVNPHGDGYIQLVINETYNLNNKPVEGINYKWEPTTGLSCTDCASPDIRLTSDEEYIITMSDSAGCFYVEDTLIVKIYKKAAADVPTAFTPNSDKTNDLFKIRGWALSGINYFRIYNRWGQMVFETTDLHQGWDGTYNGEPQAMGTFVYMFEVYDYVGNTISKKGYFDLIR